MLTQFDYNASLVIADHLDFFLVKMDADFLKWPNIIIV